MSSADRIDPGVRIDVSSAALLDYYFALSLVFGGCCTNVWAYEELMRTNTYLGSALTASQMTFVAAQALPSFIQFGSPDRSRRQQDSWWTWWPRLKPRKVPLRRWMLHVMVLTSGSLLNNWAFGFDVPLTVMIIFRSAGLAISMIYGRVFLNKRYTTIQVVSVTLVSLGVIIATLSRPSSPTRVASTSSSPAQIAEAARRYACGIAMLIVSISLTGLLGMLQERTFKKYGADSWREGVFYTHFLALPVFLFLIEDIKKGFSGLTAPKSPTLLSSQLGTYSWMYPYMILGLNLGSQVVCVSSVTRLSSQVSSVSTNVVLTTRKALSLCLSVWWFGSVWNWQLVLGAGMVFFGSFLFSSGSRIAAVTAKLSDVTKAATVKGTRVELEPSDGGKVKED